LARKAWFACGHCYAGYLLGCRAYHWLMADVRSCEQCGALFEPRREHARFCSARCRRAWNRDTLGEPVPGVNALGWSVTAMRDTADLLASMGPRHGPRAFPVIGEMVWQVTIVDATLVRHHPDAYDRVLAGQALGQRRRIEGTLGGLRFVRNRLRGDAGCGEFVGPGAGGPVTAWTWLAAPEPQLGSLPPRSRAWEMSRFRAYQAHLAGRTVGETFGLAGAFLELAADAASAGDPGTRAPARGGDRRYADA
jgi:hypothetical protein